LSQTVVTDPVGAERRRFLLPLALAQFIRSFAGSELGVMLTPSVNVVQPSFPEKLQGEISGLSRSVSNLGSTFGTAIAGTILVAGLTSGAYALAMAALGVVSVIGPTFLPSKVESQRA